MSRSPNVDPARAARARTDVWFLCILAGAALLRIYLEPIARDLGDEGRFVAMANGISFSPGAVNIPIRGLNHPALVAYVIKASIVLFGDTPSGYRAIHVVAGLVAIVVTFRVARDWFGAAAARWAAALLAFNEYHIRISTAATSHAPFLLFVALVLYAFSRFLQTGRPVLLYAAALAASLAFYCKELAVLLLPACFLTLTQPDYRVWLRNRHVFLAGAVFVALIAPDIVWNLLVHSDSAQANYSDHLARVGGIGVSSYPFAFYARDVVRWLHLTITGLPFWDPLTEYQTMNSVSGGILLVAVAAMGFRAPRDGGGRRFFLILFWVVFGFFLFVRPGHPPKGIDAVSWAWVDMTLYPAVILAGAWLAGPRGRWRTALSLLAMAAMLYAVARMVLDPGGPTTDSRYQQPSPVTAGISHTNKETRAGPIDKWKTFHWSAGVSEVKIDRPGR